MITKNILDKAKAYLSWDVCKDMTIQLIGQQATTAYYFPPNSSRHTILVFYQKSAHNFSTPLFSMFHEAGHCIQQQNWKQKPRMHSFEQLMDIPTGSERIAFEKEAWEEGRKLLKSFLLKEQIPLSQLNHFDHFSEESLKSYQ